MEIADLRIGSIVLVGGSSDPFLYLGKNEMFNLMTREVLVMGGSTPATHYAPVFEYAPTNSGFHANFRLFTGGDR